MSHRHLVGMLRPGDRNDARDPLSATANRRRPLPGQSGWTPALDRTSGTSSRLCISACERQPTTNTTRRAGGAAQAKQYPDDRATTASAGEGKTTDAAEGDQRRHTDDVSVITALTALHRADRVAGLAPDRTSCLRLRQDQDCPFPTEQHSHCSSTVRPLRASTRRRRRVLDTADSSRRCERRGSRTAKKPLRVETRYGSRALLQAAARGDLLSARIRGNPVGSAMCD